MKILHFSSFKEDENQTKQRLEGLSFKSEQKQMCHRWRHKEIWRVSLLSHISMDLSLIAGGEMTCIL